MQPLSRKPLPTIPKLARAHGFTLLEILVALTIFAVMSLITYRGISMLIDTRSSVVSETQYWRELTLAFERIENDLSQLAPRAWRDAQGQMQPALRTVNPTADTRGLEFIRFDANRAPLHGVYLCKGNALQLKLYPRADVATSDQAAEYVLLKSLSQCEFSFLNKSNQWQASWNEAELRPRAIRVRLAVNERQGAYERVFLIP